MSLVTRSLLALAALLAAARAQDNCNTKPIGSTYPCNNPIDYKPTYFVKEVIIDIPLNLCPPGMHVVGETITACNNDPNGPPPDISMLGEFTPADVTCSLEDCPQGGTVNIRQCCGY